MENEPNDKRTTKLLIAGGAVLALIIAGTIGAAINSSKESSTTSSSDYSAVEPVPVEPEPVSPISLDEQYLFAVHYTDNYLIEANTDADLIAIGKQVCTTLDAGNTVQDLMLSLVGASDGTESDAYWEFAGIIIGAGVAAYCPEYSYQIG